MKIQIILLSFFSLLVLNSFKANTNFKAEREVYICKGKSSKRYHLKNNCRGLSRCSTNIYRVSISEAKRIGRTLCGWED